MKLTKEQISELESLLSKGKLTTETKLELLEVENESLRDALENFKFYLDQHLEASKSALDEQREEELDVSIIGVEQYYKALKDCVKLFDSVLKIHDVRL